MNIENISPDRVTLYAQNAKYHPKAQVDQIAESIRRFGFRQPVVVDKDNVVVIGHGRVLAARQLGMETIPCERAEDLTSEQIKALRLADNRLNESKWKDRALRFELLELSPSIDLSGFGFEMPVASASDEAPWNDTTDYGQGATEYSPEDFSDERFECQCPECGFRFNP
jgi:ParB-like chromosome segregation protein Spo0J